MIGGNVNFIFFLTNPSIFLKYNFQSITRYFNQNS